jgi:ribosomal protein S27AE
MGILTDFREVIEGIKHKKLGEHTTKLCPKCASSRITISSGFDIYPRLYGITPRRFVCGDCGYSGPLVLEQTKEETS